MDNKEDLKPAKRTRRWNGRRIKSKPFKALYEPSNAARARLFLTAPKQRFIVGNVGRNTPVLQS